MEINLPPEVEAIITRNIATGGYHSPTEVIVQALWLLDGWNDSEEEKLEKLRRAVQEGLNGPFVPGEEVFDRLRERSAEARRRKENPVE